MKILMDNKWVEIDFGPSPAPPPSRVLTGTQFLSLWTDEEMAAALEDPKLLKGSYKVLAQNSANLDSPECALLLNRAVAKGYITPARALQIASGTLPDGTKS